MNFLSRLFQRSTGTQNIHAPMINQVYASIQGILTNYSQMARKKALHLWYEKTPELMGFINKVSRDSTSRFHFEPVGKSSSGRNRVLKAEKFAHEVKLRHIRESQFADALITGEGFGWMGKIKEEVIKSKISNLLKKEIFMETKEKNRVADDLFLQLKEKTAMLSEIEEIDEDILRPRKYRYVPSTTMEIEFDEFDVKQFHHNVGINKPIIFNPNEILHFTLMERDGKVSGFTPVLGVIMQLELLKEMWSNLLTIHKNGGSPNKIFALENVNVNSTAYQMVEKQLLEFKKSDKRHGNMLFTGKLTVQDIQEMENMQFKDSGLYITGLVAMQWGIPKSSIPFIIGGTNTKDDTGGNSERGYWEVIYSMQALFTEIENFQLWMPYFGVRIIPENPYANLDVQKQTAIMSKLNNVMTIERVFMSNGKQLKAEAKMRMVNGDFAGLSEEDLEDAPEQIEPQSAEGTGTSAQLSKAESTDSEDQRVTKARKRREEELSSSSRGTKEIIEEDRFNKYPYTLQ